MEQTHKHRDISLHSPQQRAMFFALSSQLGYPTETVKTRATKRFNHECFNEITTSELTELIDKLIEVQFRREEQRAWR